MFNVLYLLSGFFLSYWPPLLISVVFAYFCLREPERKNLPPGPRGWPLVGYIPHLGNYAHLDFMKLAKKYGNVIRVRLGENDCVILNDYESACEALGKDAFANRPDPFIFTLFGGESGLTSWNGEIWKDHRRFALKTLRTLGVGKPEMENLISEEIEDLISKWETKNGEPIRVRDFLAPSGSNIIFSVLSGHRFSEDDGLRKKLDEFFSPADLPGFPFTGFLNNFVKVFKKVFTLFPLGREAREKIAYFQKWSKDTVDEHEEAFDENNLKDFIDHYISECRNGKNPNFSKSRMAGISRDLIGAGSGTVKDAVEGVLLVVTMNPEIQKRIHSEIDEAIGRERRPTFADRVNMPYTQAVINETFRHGSRIPINLPRRASEDSTIGGYNIPKDTHVLVNFWAIHHDPKYWTDPDKFDPKRFLSEDETKLIKKESFMPFSDGKRSCPGEALAQVELFLFVVKILQKFHVEPSCNQKLTEETKLVLFTLVPKNPLELVFRPR